MKPIIFTGDSFTFGEGLELHDDMYREFVYKKCMEMEQLKKDGFEPNPNDLGYRWHNYQDFSETITPASRLRTELSYASIVSDKFKTLGFRKFLNGGSNINALNFIESCTKMFGKDKFSIAIIFLLLADMPPNMPPAAIFFTAYGVGLGR